MKTSLYFFRIELNNLQQALLNLANEHLFSGDAGEGFIVDSTEKGDLRVRFVIKETISEELEDPFGETIPLERVRFDVSNLRVRDLDIIEVSQPGRKLSKLLKLLSERLGTEPKKMIPVFSRLFQTLTVLDQDLAVLALETENFTIKSRTACRATFQALVDVREDASYFLGKRSTDTKMARISLVQDGRPILIEAFKSGRIIAHFDSSLESNNAVMKAIISALEIS